MGGKYAQLVGVVGRFTGHQFDALTLDQAAIDHPHQHHHTHIGVVPAIDNHRPQRAIRIALRWRHSGDHGFENFVYAHTGLGAAWNCIGRVYADHVFDFLLRIVRIGLRQIHFVEHWHHLDT